MTVYCTALAARTTGRRCRHVATKVVIYPYDTRRAFCEQHVGSHEVTGGAFKLPSITLPVESMSEWQWQHASVETLYGWAVYINHVRNPETTPHLRDQLADAIAHGYSGTLD